MDVVLVGAITRQYFSTVSSSFFPSLRLTGRITSLNVTLYTPIVSLSLAQPECANNSLEQSIKSSVPNGPHPLPRPAVDYSARRVSHCYDLANEPLRLSTNLGGAHNATR